MQMLIKTLSDKIREALISLEGKQYCSLRAKQRSLERKGKNKETSGKEPFNPCSIGPVAAQ